MHISHHVTFFFSPACNQRVIPKLSDDDDDDDEMVKKIKIMAEEFDLLKIENEISEFPNFKYE